ncbi:ImmA/IrrE family metallo-endopeptidase [Hungatella hathewayi]|uniref:ImmA/IrrE family metallo-endopeptidase n=1 Tax=Hungatella hathewayi TaxID=154046 RepID=UPI003562D6FB
MEVFYSKKELYKEVAVIKKWLKLKSINPQLDLVELVANNYCELEKLPFKTEGLRGISIIGNENSSDIIMLNNKRTLFEQNYDCGHEIMHLLLHRNLDQKTFNCFDHCKANQNPFLEWQANEGAAEFFLPYRYLLHIIDKCRNYLTSYSELCRFKQALSKSLCIPEAVVTFRLENLKYEIYQYLSGTDIDDIEILSARKQEELGISVQSLNQILSPF